ncbi:MAG: PAS domain S-box protein [Bryobacterales bacterium]
MTLPKPPPRHEKRVLLYALASGLPAVAATALLLWQGEHSSRLVWTVMLFVVVTWLGFSFAVRERVIFPLRTLSNLLAALREGDYTLRARATEGDAMGEVMTEVNLMSAMLREQRLSALEASRLLRNVMEEIDVAVFTFDSQERLKLVNRAGEKLLGAPSERLLDLTAEELGLGGFLQEAARARRSSSYPEARGATVSAAARFAARGGRIVCSCSRT